MWTGDVVNNQKLSIAYKSSLLITNIPVSVRESYWSFLEQVRARLLKHPFYSNLSSITQVRLKLSYGKDCRKKVYKK